MIEKIEKLHSPYLGVTRGYSGSSQGQMDLVFSWLSSISEYQRVKPGVLEDQSILLVDILLLPLCKNLTSGPVGLRDNTKLLRLLPGTHLCAFLTLCCK